ncbi:sigma-70 family RNA polymerase sigma factor [Serpentinicella sp. ANB-PHB4]|uniref:RNA polymerase sigma factor n=1 Tax=Serpentinicella sp. ANB-PHB4 TaxID=3074076 RepID=UPI002862EE15|nr:sigma-70 family RNA polymerase sigma factor [Serpentinicella sp. ANB-PHB4]MDR5659503.1 sigma-70 family RNA polymerase sigma factor [Serpentinicella sp. ANB-PHB4]
MEEKELIKKSKSGDIKSFEALVGIYQKKALNIAYRMLGNIEDANDVTQEALIKAYKAIPKFKEESSFSTWLYSIVTNTGVDYLRKNKNKNVVYLDKRDENQMQREVPDNTNTPENVLEKKEIKQHIHSAINELALDHRTVIILRDIKGFSYKEIATMLKCSEGTVKSRISRGRAHLKTIINRKVVFKTN